MTSDERKMSPLVEYLRQFYVTKGSPPLRAVAGQVGISPSGVHSILTGRTVPSSSNLRAIVGYLGADHDTARALAAKSKPGRPVPLTRRASVGDLCDEMRRLRHAVDNLAAAVRGAP